MINFTQLVVRPDKATVKWLDQNGFENPLGLPNGYNFPVFIVDTMRNRISGTNTTCMAASSSCGNKPIVLDFEQLKEKLLSL